MKTAIVIVFSVLMSSFLPLENAFQITNVPLELSKHKEKPNTYESQGRYHSTYFILEPKDSSFVYYSVFEVGYNLCVGNYQIHNDTIIFNSDYDKSVEAILDTAIYHQYFRHSTPRLLEIEGQKYLKVRDGISRID